MRRKASKGIQIISGFVILLLIIIIIIDTVCLYVTTMYLSGVNQYRQSITSQHWWRPAGGRRVLLPLPIYMQPLHPISMCCGGCEDSKRIWIWRLTYRVRLCDAVSGQARVLATVRILYSQSCRRTSYIITCIIVHLIYRARAKQEP